MVDCLDPEVTKSEQGGRAPAMVNKTRQLKNWSPLIPPRLHDFCGENMTPQGERNRRTLTSKINIATHVENNNRLFDAIVLWT
jgi:hypothetical protein